MATSLLHRLSGECLSELASDKTLINACQVGSAYWLRPNYTFPEIPNLFGDQQGSYFEIPRTMSGWNAFTSGCLITVTRQITPFESIRTNSILSGLETQKTVRRQWPTGILSMPRVHSIHIIWGAVKNLPAGRFYASDTKFIIEKSIIPPFISTIPAKRFHGEYAFAA